MTTQYYDSALANISISADKYRGPFTEAQQILRKFNPTYVVLCATNKKHDGKSETPPIKTKKLLVGPITVIVVAVVTKRPAAVPQPAAAEVSKPTQATSITMIPINRINSFTTMVATTPNKKNLMLKAVAETAHAEYSPVDYIRCIIPHEFETSGNGAPLSLNKTDATEGYTMEAVGAIRSNDVAALRYMLENGHSFDACNANGEYLIHLACRRSQPETVEFLINEAKVRVDVRDTMGRTVLHDVCWKSSPDLEMMSKVLQIAPPELLIAKDLRGHTPFDFARKQHWGKWIQFLMDNQEMIRERLIAQ